MFTSMHFNGIEPPFHEIHSDSIPSEREREKKSQRIRLNHDDIDDGWGVTYVIPILADADTPHIRVALSKRWTNDSSALPWWKRGVRGWGGGGG
jgi:hypothetical protein